VTLPGMVEHGVRRRRWLIPVVIAVVVSLVAAVAWFVGLPRYRPSLAPGERYGVDVSHHQGAIEWRRVAEDGISFAYVKATEGSDFVDPRFDANWEGAGGAGIDRGAYHFFTLCSPGTDQAANFLGALHRVADAELPPAVDLELIGNCSSRPAPSVVRSEVATFVRAVEDDTGATLILYVRDDFESRYPVRRWLSRPQWRFRFLRPPSDPWALWQVDSYARVDGIPGGVDLDVLRP